MADGEDSAGSRRKRRGGASQGDLVRRIMSELRDGEWERCGEDRTELGRSALNAQWRNHLLGRLERGDSLGQIDRDLRGIGGLSEEERAALWLLANLRCGPPPRPETCSCVGALLRQSPCGGASRQDALPPAGHPAQWSG